MKKYIVTYRYKNGVGSADFSTIDAALKFASKVYGAKIYEKIDGYYVPYKASRGVVDG